MKKVKIILLLLICLLSSTAFTQVVPGICDPLHKGTFIYFYKNKKIKVVIKKDTHTEYHENGKYIILSKLFWINECEFVATCIKTTIPNPFFKVDDQIHVVANKIQHNEIYFTSTINRNKWKGKLVKIE